MSVGKDYEVLISKSVRTEKNILGHTLTLMDRPIFKPKKEKFWPDPKKPRVAQKSKISEMIYRMWGDGIYFGKGQHKDNIRDVYDFMLSAENSV